MNNVCIIILNYNGWRDTVECLESVLRLKYPEYSIIIVDNGSTDESVEKIKEWAEGKIQAECSNLLLKYLTFPPVDKPIPLEVIEVSGNTVNSGTSKNRIVLIKSGANLGYAGGINIGLKYAQAGCDFRYIWLLNNDTVVEPSALTALVKRTETCPDAGLCGSTLLYYYRPDTIQARAGAQYNKWLALSRHIDVFKPSDSPFTVADIERRISYICGASMLVRREFVEKIGLMNEEYFLYFEELDWAVRAKREFKMAYAPESIVYHKEGGSIGSSSAGAKKSRMADFYSQRNRLVFTRKHFPKALPTVYLGMILSTMNRIRRGQWRQALMLAKMVLHLS